jgi:hypothetical protein
MKGQARLTPEIAEVIRKMLAAGICRKQIREVTGIALPQISTIAIASGLSKNKPRAKAMAAPLPEGKE